jgi:hypothetical protein
LPHVGEGNDIFVAGTKVGVSRSQADTREWQAFVARLERDVSAKRG